jgi:protein subunit release factor A
MRTIRDKLKELSDREVQTDADFQQALALHSPAIEELENSFTALKAAFQRWEDAQENVMKASDQAVETMFAANAAEGKHTELARRVFEANRPNPN